MLSLHPYAQSRQLSTAFYSTVASNPVLLYEGLKFTLKAKFFIFNGKIDKCCTEHLLFEDLQGKIDTQQFPSSRRYSWRTRDKTISCKERGKKTVEAKMLTLVTAQSGMAGRELRLGKDRMLFMLVLQ